MGCQPTLLFHIDKRQSHHSNLILVAVVTINWIENNSHFLDKLKSYALKCCQVRKQRGQRSLGMACSANHSKVQIKHATLELKKQRNMTFIGLGWNLCCGCRINSWSISLASTTNTTQTTTSRGTFSNRRNS